MVNYYAGIGSRQTPQSLRVDINNVSVFLERYGYILRSGGASGADTFFEEKVSKKEIYLPWKGFNKNESKLYTITPAALKLAEKYHPKWSMLTSSGRSFMARNCYQVLGYDLNTSVKFILCYTTDGYATGGTGQAIRIAEDMNIPVINMYFDDWKDKLKKLLI